MHGPYKHSSVQWISSLIDFADFWAGWRKGRCLVRAEDGYLFDRDEFWYWRATLQKPMAMTDRVNQQTPTMGQESLKLHVSFTFGLLNIRWCFNLIRFFGGFILVKISCLLPLKILAPEIIQAEVTAAANVGQQISSEPLKVCEAERGPPSLMVV